MIKDFKQADKAGKRDAPKEGKKDNEEEQPDTSLDFTQHPWTLGDPRVGKNAQVTGKGPLSYLDHLHASPYPGHWGSQKTLFKVLEAKFPGMTPEQAQETYTDWLMKRKTAGMDGMTKHSGACAAWAALEQQKQ